MSSDGDPRLVVSSENNCRRDANANAHCWTVALLARVLFNPLSRAAARHARDTTKVFSSFAVNIRNGCTYGLAAGVSPNGPVRV